MGTASPLIHTAVAESPVALIATAALPEAIIGRRLANIAEETCYQATRRIVIRDLPVATRYHLRIL